VKFVINGHSERRHVLNEPSEMIAKKAETIHKGGLVLVHCVGETIEQRDASQTLDAIGRQLGEIGGLLDDPGRVIIAYEPVWAIGTGKVAGPDQAQEAHQAIRQRLTRISAELADKTAVLYGGSVKPDNAANLLACPDVDGALVGGASLDASSFLQIVRAARS